MDMTTAGYNYQMPVWYWIVLIAVIAFSIVTRWIVYRKAGEHGWAAIIPFYSEYCLCRIAKKQKLFLPYILTVIAAVVVSIIMAMWIVVRLMTDLMRLGLTGSADATFDTVSSALAGMFIFIVILIAIGIASLILQIFILHGVSVSFGHGGGFTAGLVLLSLIFWAILAFGKSRYIPENREEGPDAAPNAGAGGEPFTNITCQFCGTRFFHDESRVSPGEEFTCFCPSCGEKLTFRKQ